MASYKTFDQVLFEIAISMISDVAGEYDPILKSSYEQYNVECYSVIEQRLHGFRVPQNKNIIKE